jgi:hypothetical protein
MLREKPGNVVVLSGRNRGKMDRILASIEGGLSVLADKPWLISAPDFPKLEKALDVAGKKGLVAYDVMTERSEITTILQKELVLDPGVTGTVGPGTQAEPAIEMESVHHLMKVVSGSVNLRPAWFFDTQEQGEALGDVATHLVDLVPTLYPDQAIDYHSEIRVSARLATVLDRARTAASGEKQRRPPSPRPEGGSLITSRTASLRSARHPRRLRRNEPQAPEGGGDARAIAWGVAPGRDPGRRAGWRPTVRRAGRPPTGGRPRSTGGWPSSRPAPASVEDEGWRLRVGIPDRYRVGHEAHFAEVTARFLGYLKDPASLPKWEKPNMLAKYWVTTQAVEMSR